MWTLLMVLPWLTLVLVIRVRSRYHLRTVTNLLAALREAQHQNEGYLTPDLMDAVAADSDMTVLILDNQSVAMTGTQDPVLPSSRLEQIVLAVGVEVGAALVALAQRVEIAGLQGRAEPAGHQPEEAGCADRGHQRPGARRTDAHGWSTTGSTTGRDRAARGHRLEVGDLWRVPRRARRRRRPVGLRLRRLTRRPGDPRADEHRPVVSCFGPASAFAMEGEAPAEPTCFGRDYQ